MSDRIVSKPSNATYRDGWERAFGREVLSVQQMLNEWITQSAETNDRLLAIYLHRMAEEPDRCWIGADYGTEEKTK